MGTIMSHFAHCSIENTSPRSSKWQKLKLCLLARKTRAWNQISMDSLREEDRSSEFVQPETIVVKIEDLRGQTLRELGDLNDYIDLMVSISNSIKEYNEVSDINLLVEKINRFKKARDPFAAFVEMIPLLSERRREVRQNIQTVEGENELKLKRLKIWKKLIRITSGLFFVISIIGVLSLSFVAPPLAVIPTFAATLVRWGEELMLSFCKKREGVLKETIKLVDSIKEGSALLDDPLAIGRIEKFSSGDMKKFKSVVDQLIQDKKVNVAKKGVDGLTFPRRAVDVKEQIEKWCDLIKQRPMMEVCSPK